MLEKTDEMSSNNVFKLTKEKLISIANNATRLDVRSNNRGYHKLKSTWLPRSCQTMKDHPTQLNFSYWNREDVSLLENWIAGKQDVSTAEQNKEKHLKTVLQPDQGVLDNWITNQDDDNSDENSCSFYSRTDNNNSQQEIDFEQEIRSIENWLHGRPTSDSSNELIDKDEISNIFPEDNQVDLESDLNNNGIKSEPVIVMNDEFIEIHFDYDDEVNKSNSEHLYNCSIDNSSSFNSPRSNYVDIKPSRIIKTRGLSPIHPPLYKNFLEKTNDNDDNSASEAQNCSVKDEESVDDCIGEIKTGYDKHRSLFQYYPKVEEKTSSIEIESTSVKHKSPNFRRIGSCKIKSEDLPSSFAESKREMKSFLSFRKPKKKPNSCKNKFIVGEEGVAGPIWPAVLLTYDRSISPTPDSKQSPVHHKH